jgi:hypothetical protein
MVRKASRMRPIIASGEALTVNSGQVRGRFRGGTLHGSSVVQLRVHADSPGLRFAWAIASLMFV